MEPRKIVRIIVGYFFRGLLVIVPITVVSWVVYELFLYLDSIIKTDIPGLGLLILLLIITGIGLLASTLLFQPFVDMGNDLLKRVPVLNTLYSALKDMMEALVGNKKKFDRPVLVRLSRDSEVEKPGFITQDDLSQLGVRGNKVSVYLPHSFAWSGNLLIVPAENVTPLNGKATDVMKFILSGGVAMTNDDA